MELDPMLPVYVTLQPADLDALARIISICRGTPWESLSVIERSDLVADANLAVIAIENDQPLPSRFGMKAVGISTRH
jgi:hypothetical protein